MTINFDTAKVRHFQAVWLTFVMGKMDAFPAFALWYSVNFVIAMLLIKTLIVGINLLQITMFYGNGARFFIVFSTKSPKRVSQGNTKYIPVLFNIFEKQQFKPDKISSLTMLQYLNRFVFNRPVNNRKLNLP